MTTHPARAQARAWLILVVGLALHVTDEALTGFLDFYNPLVLRLRERIGFWPMPTFTFGVWLAGLIALVIVLAALTPLIAQRPRFARIASVLFGAVMAGNGVAHLAGSLYFWRWLPGATSAPVIFAAAVLLLQRARMRAA